MNPALDAIDPERDLVLERVVPVKPETVWMAWTKPQHLMRWFAPRPFETTECDIDLRPGGIFRTVMRSPEGAESESVGCYLQVVERERLVWTTALDPGFRPKADAGDLPFTAVITVQASDGGTRYRALARHSRPDNRDRHEELGFYNGWATALDQLVELYS